MAKRGKTERQKLEDAVWKHTHRDFKGMLRGKRSILVLEPGHGTTLQLLSDVSDAELRSRLPKLHKCEHCGLMGAPHRGGGWYACADCYARERGQSSELPHVLGFVGQAYKLNPGWRWNTNKGSALGESHVTYPSGVRASVRLSPNDDDAILTVTKRGVTEQHRYANPVGAMDAADEEYGADRSLDNLIASVNAALKG
jgi:hypothetical protein